MEQELEESEVHRNNVAIQFLHLEMNCSVVGYKYSDAAELIRVLPLYHPLSCRWARTSVHIVA